MESSLDRLLSPFNSADAYWYLAPKGFWPGMDNPKGIPGFHRFLEVLVEHQEWDEPWGRDRGLEVLIPLEDEEILPSWEDQEDFHAHFRNRITFAKKLGFGLFGEERPLRLTAVGAHFLQSSPEQWPEIFEHQLIRLQFTNPSMPRKYARFHLFPYIFTLSLLLDVEGNSLSLEEFVLRAMISQSHDEKPEVLAWVNDFRNLSDVRVPRDSTSMFAGRTVAYLFSCTPSVQFGRDMLSLRDPDRARYLLAKCWPYLNYVEYASEDEWAAQFGSFESALWPLLSETTERRRLTYREYVRREESDAHKTIKRYLVENAEVLFGGGTRLFEEEYTFSSNDRANLVFSLPQRRYLTVEVEVDVGEGDITGLLQAVKYKYMFAVQEGLGYEQVDGLLVARSIHPSVRAACERYGIAWREIDPTKGDG